MPLAAAGVPPGRLVAAQVGGLDPSLFFGAPRPLRAAAVFGLTVLFGGAVLYQYGGRLAAATAASRDHPLYAVLYGLVAYGLVAFFVGYGYTQLLQVGVGRTAITAFALVVFVVLVFSLGGLGYVVVGTWVTSAFGFRDPWVGLLGVSLVGSLGWLVLPPLPALLVWVGIAAVGAGGTVRMWMHAEAVDRAVG